ncbi:DUF4438 domain-containing protein [Candidatus Bathyarchaeota archaeon]|nr:DUF4438 domain-containing protein [Candidatus Bathyarchaeota archaeon]
MKTVARVGNKVKVIEGEAKGDRGVVVCNVGSFPGGAHHALISFGEETLENFGFRVFGLHSNLVDWDGELLDAVEIENWLG